MQFLVFYAELFHILSEILSDMLIGNQTHGYPGTRFPDTDTGRFIHHFLRYEKRKYTSLFIFALHPYIALHQMKELLGNSQTESGSFDITVTLAVQLLERTEQLIAVLFPDADSGIFHRNMQFYISVIYLQIIHFQHYLSGIRKLRRIIGNIEQHLLDADIIP